MHTMQVSMHVLFTKYLLEKFFCKVSCITCKCANFYQWLFCFLHLQTLRRGGGASPAISAPHKPHPTNPSVIVGVVAVMNLMWSVHIYDAQGTRSLTCARG